MTALTEKQIELITSKVIKVYEEQKEASEKKEKNKRLRNTKLLLRHYRTFKSYAQKIEDEKEVELEEINFLELLTAGQDLVKSIKESTRSTLIMVRHIDHALATLKYVYSLEKHPGTRRQYAILHARFVDGVSISEVAEENGMDNRSIYKAIDAAVERLSILLFGVYGLEFG